MRKHSFASLFVLFLLLVSSAAQLFIVLRYSTNVIYSDQIEYIPLLEHLDWRQLSADFVGHRRIFPKLLFVFLAKITRWDVRWETFLNWVFLQSSVILLFLILKKNVVRSHLWIIGLSLTYFLSPQYYDDLLWGIQNCVQMNLFCTVCAVYLLSRKQSSIRTDIAVFLLLIVATFSFGNGLAAWPAVLPLFVLSRSAGSRSLSDTLFLQRQRIAVFAAIALAVFTFYLWDFYSYPELSSFQGDPWKLFSYFFTFLGGGVIVVQEYYKFPQELYMIFGMLLFGFFVTAFLPGRVDLKKKLPQISLALFILGSALMAALARTYTWNDQALDSRYLILSMLFPVLAVNIHLRSNNERKPLSWSGAVLLLLLAAEIFPGWLAGASLSAAWSARQREQAKILHAYRTVPDDQLYEHFVYSHGVREKLGILEKLKYNIFR